MTSGLHERRFTRGGRTYHHILNPTDGMPARTDVASATIIASTSIDCDGYSTAALMLGMDEGPAFVEGIDGVEGVFISDTDEVRWTSGTIDCDGYSTAALMLGMDEGPAFVEGIDGVEGVFISDADEVRWTSGIMDEGPAFVEGIDGVEGVFISDADEVRWTSGIADRLSLVPTLPRW